LLEGGARRMGLEGEVRRRERRGGWRDKVRGIGLEGGGWKAKARGVKLGARA
jgi:hypothetical protein